MTAATKGGAGRTTLEVYCEAMGQQGGTIHDAMRAFCAAPMQTKDSVCNALMRAIDAKTLDLRDGIAAQFFSARIGAKS